MSVELAKELKNRKISRKKAIQELILNSDFSKMTRTNKLNLLNKIRPNNVPHINDRCNITIDLYNHCIQNKNFNLFDNVEYICSLINDSRYRYYNTLRVYSPKELNKFDPKLYKRLNKDLNNLLDSNDIKIILWLTSFLKGVPYYSQNNLFDSYKFYMKGVEYYGIVRKSEEITTRTYRELRFFNYNR